MSTPSPKQPVARARPAPPWGPEADRQVHQLIYHLIAAQRRQAAEAQKDGTNG